MERWHDTTRELAFWGGINSPFFTDHRLRCSTRQRGLLRRGAVGLLAGIMS